MFVSKTISIPATSVNNNILTGEYFEFASADMLLDYGFVAGAAGLTITVYHADRLVAQDLVPTVKAAAPQTPVFPDDFLLRAEIAMAGQRLIIRVRNSTGAAVDLFYVLKTA